MADIRGGGGECHFMNSTGGGGVSVGHLGGGVCYFITFMGGGGLVKVG